MSGLLVSIDTDRRAGVLRYAVFDYFLRRWTSEPPATVVPLPVSSAGEGVIRGLKIKAGCEQPEDNHEKRYQRESVHIHHPFDVVLYLIGILWMNVNWKHEF